MFERFTAGARAIVVQAQENARRLGHGYIGCEHLLLAAASTGEPAGAALRELGVTPEGVEAEIVRLAGLGQAAGLFSAPNRDALASIGIDIDAVRGDAQLAQGGARRLAGGSGGEQEMLTADIAVSQPAGVLLGLHHDGTGAGGETLEHQRLPVRRPCARHPACPVAPGRPAISVFSMCVSLC